MRKEILIALSILLFVSAASAEPLKSMDVKQGFSSQFYGGDTQEIMTSFENTVSKDLPLYVRLNISSEDEMTGEEFEVSVSLNSTNSDSFRYSELDCHTLEGPQYDHGAETMIYSCWGTGEEILGAESEASENNLTANIESHPALKPGEYQMEMTILTRIGEVVEKQTQQDVQTAQFDMENTSVSFDSNTASDVTVWRYSEMFVSSPDNREFVNGIEKVVSPTSVNSYSCLPFVGNQISKLYDHTSEGSYWFDQFKCKKDKNTDGGGSVKFNYSEDMNPDTLGIYRFNSSSNNWNEIEVTIDTAEKTVSANLTSPGTYSAYANKTDNSQNGDDNSGLTVTGGFGSGGTSSPGGQNVTIGDVNGGGDGSSSESEGDSDNESEQNLEPRPDFDINYTEPSIRENVVLDASDSFDPDGTIETYEWSFGRNGEVVTHTFPEQGEIDITLTVYDDDGANASTTQSLRDTDSASEGSTDEQTDNPGANNPAGSFTTAAEDGYLLFILLMLLGGMYYVYRKDGFTRFRSSIGY